MNLFFIGECFIRQEFRQKDPSKKIQMIFLVDVGEEMLTQSAL